MSAKIYSDNRIEVINGDDITFDIVITKTSDGGYIYNDKHKLVFTLKEDINNEIKLFSTEGVYESKGKFSFYIPGIQTYNLNGNYIYDIQLEYPDKVKVITKDEENKEKVIDQEIIRVSTVIWPTTFTVVKGVNNEDGNVISNAPLIGSLDGNISSSPIYYKPHLSDKGILSFTSNDGDTITFDNYTFEKGQDGKDGLTIVPKFETLENGSQKLTFVIDESANKEDIKKKLNDINIIVKDGLAGINGGTFIPEIDNQGILKWFYTDDPVDKSKLSIPKSVKVKAPEVKFELISKNEYDVNTGENYKGNYKLTIDGKSYMIKNGHDGKDGQDGKPGENGQNGSNGAAGKDGRNGVSPIITSRQDEDGNYHLTITNYDDKDEDAKQVIVLKQGKPGYTPTINAYRNDNNKSVSLVIHNYDENGNIQCSTRKQALTIYDGKDGEKGEKGDTPKIKSRSTKNGLDGKVIYTTEIEKDEDGNEIEVENKLATIIYPKISAEIKKIGEDESGRDINDISIVTTDLSGSHKTESIRIVSGIDGISPTFNCKEITNGNELTINDKEGSKTIRIMNGYSPKVSIKKDYEKRITCITSTRLNKDGKEETWCETIRDGINGKNGKDGIDGYSPIINYQPITNGNELTINDKEGSKTIRIMNGLDGKKGETGDPGIIERDTPPEDTQKIWIQDIPEENLKNQDYFLIGQGISKVRLVDEYPLEPEKDVLYLKYLD